jgi:dTDP-L-rhamnose 4-epimerase
MQTVLITGGAGFIGSHVADELLRHGYSVRVLDSLVPQVHGESGTRPRYLDPRIDMVVGDIRDREALCVALDDCDAVLHCAAAVGVGQSMYELAHYTAVNNLGTARMLERLIEKPVKKLVVASSMSVYGEGQYVGPDGRHYDRVERSLEQLKEGEWDPIVADPATGSRVRLEPVATAEDKPPALASIYALSKYDQERMALIAGRAYEIPTVALRLFNTYGPRQALTNPYTGVLAIFAARLLQDEAPTVYEDGLQRRDFVSVRDVARACRQALESDAADGEVLNIGSGVSHTVREVAERLARALGKSGIEPDTSGRYRVGDVRHCWADISRARAVLGYEPEVTLDDGLAELAEWLKRGARQEDAVAWDRGLSL